MITTIRLTCENSNCGKIFKRRKSEHINAVRKGYTHSYCSRSCGFEANKTLSHKECLNPDCGKVFKQKSQTNNFCSISCATSVKNKNRTKTNRSPKYNCPNCGQSVKKPVKTSCSKCNILDNKTLQELKDSYSISQYHAKIRSAARLKYKGEKICAACGYKLHVDICHIIDVKDFPMETLIKEVNAHTNLIALDKRCHWEFDHGFLLLREDGNFVVAEPGLEPGK